MSTVTTGRQLHDLFCVSEAKRVAATCGRKGSMPGELG
jgi:hypothetical protein